MNSVEHTLLINGILGKPSLADAWTDRRARYIQLRTPNKARAIENAFWLIRSKKRINHYAQQLAYEIRAYNQAGIIPNVEAHSNGNVLLLKALSLDPYLKIARFTMLFPAAYASFKHNGANRFLQTGQIDNIVFVGSKNDKTVRRGGGATKWLRPLGYGYGTLSYEGPQDVAFNVKLQVREVWKNSYGHSTFSERGVMTRFFKELYQ